MKITKKMLSKKRYYLQDETIFEINGIGFKAKHKKIYAYLQNYNGKYRKVKICNITDIVKIENI